MGSLHFMTVAAHLVLTVPREVMERHGPIAPGQIGEELAEAVLEYALRERLGYFPALAFFREQGGIDPDLLEAADALAWLAGELVRDEVLRRLQPAFSQVDVSALKPVANTMPRVRLSSRERRELLARHFTPDTVRVTLLLTSIQKRPARDEVVRFARRTLWRWLRDHFAAMEVCGTKVI